MEESNSKLKTIFIGAIIVALMLIAGGIDNDYTTKRGRGSDRCEYQRIATATEICK